MAIPDKPGVVSTLSIVLWLTIWLIGHLLPVTCEARTISRVSVTSKGKQVGSPGYGNFNPSISSDGRFVAFYSETDELVSDDTNRVDDVFVHDRNTYETTRVSVASDGHQGNGDSRCQSISGDGRFVAFSSRATNLVDNDINGDDPDVFLHDRKTGDTILVSIDQDGNQVKGIYHIVNQLSVCGFAFSGNGRFVAFHSSNAILLFEKGDNWRWECASFMYDRETGRTTRFAIFPYTIEGHRPASPYGSDDCPNPVPTSVSDDGQLIVFRGYDEYSLVDKNPQRRYGLFVHNRTSGELIRAVESEYSSFPGVGGEISGDGRFVAFASDADDLVPNDTNSKLDTFVYDLSRGGTTRVSVASDGTQGNDHSGGDEGFFDYSDAGISADGRYVVFSSLSNNLVPEDMNDTWDVFRHDRKTGETIRVSVAADGKGRALNSFSPSISADGKVVAFESQAGLVPDDGNGGDDIYVVDYSEGTSNKNLGDCECAQSAGNPINAGTGNKYQVETDFLAASHTQLALRRYYNSGTGDATAFGANWRSTFDRTLKRTSANLIEVTRADGRVDTFRKSGNTWKADPDVISRLSASSGGDQGWDLLTGDDTTEHYAADGRLLTITTRAGLTQTLAYDANNRLSTVTGPFGHRLTFAYDAGGHVTQVTTPSNRAYRYAYDSESNLIKVTYPGTTGPKGPPIRRYHYENRAFPHALTGITDENEDRFATFAYDRRGRAVSSAHAGGAEKTSLAYNDDGTTTVADAGGSVYTAQFATQFDRVKPAALSGTPALKTGGKGFSYDARGFLASRTDFNGNVTEFTHNARGLETSRTEAAGTPLARTVTTQWHMRFRLPVRITEPGRESIFRYDNHGNLLQRTVIDGSNSRTWSYSYNDFGQVLSVDGPRTDLKDVTRFTYDVKGNLASITNARGQVTKWVEYDADGRLLKAEDPNGLITKAEYDQRGLLAAWDAGGEGAVYSYQSTGLLQRIYQFGDPQLLFNYDTAHRLVRVDEVGHAFGQEVVRHVDYTLDAMGNRVKEDIFDAGDALTQTRAFGFDTRNLLTEITSAEKQSTTFDYDANGNSKRVSDPLQHVTTQAYDALDRLTAVADAAKGITRYGYDTLDRLIRVKDPRGLVTSYSYDGLDNLLSVQSPDTGTTTHTYDEAGNLLTSTDARGMQSRFSYDALNRLTKASFADEKIIAYRYDQGTNGLGRLTQMTDPSGITQWEYDPHGRVTRKTQKTGTVTQTVTYAYSLFDPKGRLIGVTYPSGRKITYGYTTEQRQISSIAVDGTVILHQAQHRPFGPVAGWVWGNGTTYSRRFDLDGRVTGLPLGSDLRSLEYDAASRVTALIDPGAEQDFGYDALDRLTSFTSGSRSQTFTYDRDGNRLSLKTEKADIAYRYGKLSNRLLSQEGPDPKTYRYDAAGNLTKDGTHVFSYDGRGRLTQVTKGALTFEYAINGLGQRVVKQGPAFLTGTGRFVYDEAGHLLGEYDGKGNPVQETVWLGDTPVAVLQGGQVFYVYADHLGTPRGITNQSGKLLWRWDSDPFGSDLPNEDPDNDGTRFIYNNRFPGQYFDSETGLHYNYFRDYNPQAGRYIQSDPVGIGGGTNVYTYVSQSNPVYSIDPLGLAVINFVPDLEPYRGYDEPGKLLIFGHGSSQHFWGNGNQDISPAELAELVFSNADYQPGMEVKLYACHAGQGENSYAQQLADALGMLADTKKVPRSVVVAGNGFVKRYRNFVKPYVPKPVTYDLPWNSAWDLFDTDSWHWPEWPEWRTFECNCNQNSSSQQRSP